MRQCSKSALKIPFNILAPWIVSIFLASFAAALENPQEYAPWLITEVENAAGLSSCADDLEKNIDADPFSVAVRTQLVRCYRLKGDLTNAQKHVEIARNLAPSNSIVVLETTLLRLAQRRFSECLSLSDYLLRAEPKKVGVLLTRSYCARRSGRLLSAAEDLKRLAAFDPSEPIYQTELADVYIQMGNFGLATEHLQTASRLDSSNSQLWIKLGDLAYRRNDYSEAEKQYSKALPAGQDFSSSQVATAFKLFASLVNLSKWEAANQIAYKLIEHPEFVTRTAEPLIKAFGGAGEFAKASKLLERVRSLYPDLLWAHLQHAHLFVKVGKFDLAEGAIKQGLGVDPNSTELKLLHAFTLDSVGDPASAAEVLEGAAKHDPGNPKIWFNLALTLAKSGQVDKAEKAYLRVRSDRGLQYKASVNLALLFEAQSKLTEARAVLVEALRLSTKSGPDTALLQRKIADLAKLARKQQAERGLAAAKEGELAQ
jgi:tetratricopeptide (TPR) repeat protein